MAAHIYDSRCYDLSVIFLSDTPDIDNEKNRGILAQTIQTAIEDEITYMEGPCGNCGEARGKPGHEICHQIP